MNRPAAVAITVLALTIPIAPSRGDEPSYTRQEDVIYGRKFGTALTMDVFRPKTKANGAAVVIMVSGGFFSAHEQVNPGFALPFVQRGYTAFEVVHGSQPRYTVDEIVKDVNRAVRFIRYHAKDYDIDPHRIGVTGASAGGHLSLMLGTAGDTGDPKAKDPIDRESSRVQVVACFFPPTDLLNYGATGHAMLRATDHAKQFRPAFDYREFDTESGLWVSVKDESKLKKIAADVSPITHVTADDAPTLIIHGDADPLVPLQQSQMMVEALKKAGVDAKLVTKPKAGHGWLTIAQDFPQFVDWFDAHLKPADQPAAAGR